MIFPTPEIVDIAPSIFDGVKEDIAKSAILMYSFEKLVINGYELEFLNSVKPLWELYENCNFLENMGLLEKQSDGNVSARQTTYKITLLGEQVARLLRLYEMENNHPITKEILEIMIGHFVELTGITPLEYFGTIRELREIYDKLDEMEPFFIYCAVMYRKALESYNIFPPKPEYNNFKLINT